jgi:hypothetical protein
METIVASPRFEFERPTSLSFTSDKFNLSLDFLNLPQCFDYVLYATSKDFLLLTWVFVLQCPLKSFGQDKYINLHIMEIYPIYS